MRILITGGAGFIGSHLATYHLSKNDEVWVVDNLSTGEAINLASAQRNPSYRFSKASLLDWKQLPEALEWAEGVYHMAAIVGQKLVLKNPTRVLYENVEGCRVLFEKAAEISSAAKILIASSSEVYNFAISPTFREEDLLIFPSQACQQVTYPLSKYSNEVTALSYAEEKGVQTVIARLFNTSGPAQKGRYGMVVPTFIKQALFNQPLTVYGDGSQTRSFCHVDDMVRMLEILLKNNKQTGQIYNVGSDEEIAILDLAKKVVEITGSSSPITFIPMDTAYDFDFKDILRRRPDLTKFLKDFIFERSKNLGALIQDLAASLKNPARL